MKKFYTYIHCEPDGTPFYIGKGSGNRAYDFSGRNISHKNIVKKYGKDNIGIFIFPCESDEEAKLDEKLQILQCRKEGFDMSNISIMPKIRNIDNEYNKILAKEARKRRKALLARYKELHKVHGCHAMSYLANEQKLSVQRISFMLNKAKNE